MSEVAKQSMNLNHMNIEIFKIMYDFMYYEHISFDVDQLMDLLKASDYLQIKQLKEMCVDEIPTILKHANAISWMKLVDKLNLPDVKALCMDIMVSNFPEVSQQKDFLTMSDTEVQDYFGAVIGSDINVDNILDSTMRWISHDAENRLIHLEDLLKLIELNNCSVQGIADVMQAYKVLVVSNMDVFTMSMDAIKENSAKQEKQLTKAPINNTLIIVGGKVNDK